MWNKVIILYFLNVVSPQQRFPTISISYMNEKDENGRSKFNFVSKFFQLRPQEGEPATESTVVYIWQDQDNLYITLKCFDSEPQKLDIKKVPRDYVLNGDNVWIYLDTFGSKITAYEFGVNVAGVQCDGYVQEDGRYTEYSWDGVWYSAVKITEYGYNVEMKIPFKTLRFKPGLTEWGINFFRYIARKNECVSWAPLKQAEGIRVSRCGILKGINPGKQGLHLEIYPVGIARYDSIFSPKAGLDISWNFTSSQFSLTTYPDRDAIISNFHWYTRKFILLGQYMKCDTLFDVGRIGFVPWKGITKYSFVGGPQWFNKSIFRSLSIGIGVINEKEDGEPKSGYGIMCKLFFNFVNNWGSSTNFITGKDYEMDRYYDYYKIQSMFWSDYSKPVVTEANLSYTSYGYNYNRGYFGSMSQNSLSIEYRVSPPLSVSCDIVNSMEWSPEDTTIITWVGRPILQYAITKDMHIRIYTEPNPETKIHQFNLLFSYNFRPKSWFYIALNETRDNRKGRMELSKRIGIIKLRYLFFF